MEVRLHTGKEPGANQHLHHGNDDFPTMELARESALHDARVAIDETR
jgi:hypothetical protein